LFISFTNLSKLLCKFDTVSVSVATVVSSSIDRAVLFDVGVLFDRLSPPLLLCFVVIFLGGNSLLDQESVELNGVAVKYLKQLSCPC
jgi:hypothetical protein